MFDWIKARVLRLMRVPHEPDAPVGAPGSVRIFRAGLNLYYLRVARWALGQGGALVGIGFSLVILGTAEMSVERARRAAALPSPSPSPSPSASVAPDALAPGSPVGEVAAPAGSPSESRPGRPARTREERRRAQERIMTRVIASTPAFVIPLIKFIEFGGLALFAIQALMTYSIVRLEFEQHWYIVTDRSLRIRTGILRLQESTMSFANIQQVEIRQGPLQRVLGLADVMVRSAGGSEPQAGQHGKGAHESLHMGRFEGVPNAVEIRDLILERLRAFREAGLGDPDDKHASPAVGAPHVGVTANEAANELLQEARALRQACSAPPLDNLPA